MHYKSFASVVIALCILFTHQQDARCQTISGTSGKIVSIPYGKGGLIKYDLQTGLMNIYQDDRIIFMNICSFAKIDGDTITSSAYTKRSCTKTNITDGFGKGVKYIINLSGNNRPLMKQIFYTYPARSFFLQEAEIEGTGLKSNYIAPFAGKFTAISGDVRTLFMPFDNDAFISYNSIPFVSPVTNISAEAGIVYDNNTRNGLIAGSVEHKIWKTGVSISSSPNGDNTIEVAGGYVSESLTRDKIAHGTISGNRIKSPKIFVGYFADWRAGMEEYGKANRISEPPYVFNWTNPTPVGWNSWGAMQEKISLEKVGKVTSFFADSLTGFRTGNTAYIDLDSYWDNLLRRDQEDAFIQLKQVVADCMLKGLEPGIYWAPFVDWGSKSDGDRKAEGSSYTFREMWTKTAGGYHDFDGARALDPTHPGTRQRIAWMIGKFKECGFKMIKIDFLGHAAIESDKFYDPRVTTGMQAYCKGMEYLTDQMGSQMLVYAAISPNLATGRYVHTRRIACDAFKSISDTRYTLNSLTYGWWQTYLYNYIDADHVVLGNEKPGANRARFLSSVITGTVITGDDFSAGGPWSVTAKNLYQNKELLEVIKYGQAFRPVEGNTGKGASEIFVRRDGGELCLAVFNYNESPKTFSVPYSRLGLSPKQQYEARELLQGSSLPASDTFSVTLNGADASFYKIKTRNNE